MKIRFLVMLAAVAVLCVGERQLAAQQMSPYGMVGGYQPAAPMGYPGGYPAAYPQAMPQAIPQAIPPQFDVRQVATGDPAQGSAGCNSCDDGSCGSCGNCCGVNDCWCHCVAVWGEFLYLRARNAEVAYAVPIDGPIVGPPANNPIQIGRIGMVDQDWDPGFRLGFAFVFNGWSSLSLQYTRFESTRSDQVDTNAPNVLRSMVSHPGTLTAAQDFLSARASHRLKFDFLDADYRHVIDCCGNRVVTFLVGVRAGQYNQDFLADFYNTGVETVETEIDFYGAGLRVGLEGERFSRSRRWMVYGKTAANIVAGEFTADYRQGQSFDPQVVDTTWKAGRIVPMLDLELGVGWQSCCGTWRITGGYMVSAWYNTVKTDEWIKAVQSNNVVGLSGGTTFDGLVLRCEGRF